MVGESLIQQYESTSTFDSVGTVLLHLQQQHRKIQGSNYEKNQYWRHYYIPCHDVHYTAWSGRLR
jgi:hypothetical protein